MTNKKDFEDSARFVAAHYRPGAFSERRAWQRLGIGHRAIWGLSRRAAAALIVGAVLTVSACVLTFVVPQFTDRPTADKPGVTEKTVAPAHKGDVRKIEFTDAPLSEVIAEIERVYGVTVTNRPEGDYRLTLSYEGDVDSLIETINQLLDISLTVER